MYNRQTVFSRILIHQARKLYADDDFGLQLQETVYALDTAIIDLCPSVFAGLVTERPPAPSETFDDGVAVMDILMALQRLAEMGELVKMPCPELETHIPPVARSEF